MMGIDSCGMLISAVHHENGEEKLHLLMVDPHIPGRRKALLSIGGGKPSAIHSFVKRRPSGARILRVAVQDPCTFSETLRLRLWSAVFERIYERS